MRMAEGGKGKGGSEMELEAGEIVSDVEMPGLSGDTRSGGQDGRRLGNNVVGEEEDSACSKEEDGEISLHGEVPQDVLLAAQAAEVPVNGNGNGVKNNRVKNSRVKKVVEEEEEEEEESEEEEEVDDGNAGGMVEEDSDPLEESDESSEEGSDEEDGDVNAGDLQKSHIEGEEELEKMVQRAKDGDSDEEDDGATEPPRTANEVTVPVL